MLFLHVTTWPHMLLEYTAGQQRWIFSSCGLSNAEYLSQTRRQHALGHKHSLSHACVMPFHWLWEGICKKKRPHLCLSPFFADYSRGMQPVSGLRCTKTHAWQSLRVNGCLTGADNVWGLLEEPTAKTRPVRFTSSRWAKTSQAFVVFNRFFVLVFSVFSPDSRTMQCLEWHGKVARSGKIISVTQPIQKAT